VAGVFRGRECSRTWAGSVRIAGMLFSGVVVLS